MNIKDTFAQQFARISQASNKAAFEVRFDSVQRGLLRQMNEKITDVNKSGVERQVEQLQKKRDGLVEKANNLRDLQNDMKTNALRFLEIRDKADAAIASADTDEDGSLSDDEVAALNVQIQDIAAEIAKLKFTHQHTEFTDGNLANRMRQQSVALSELTATTGVIDGEDDPKTNDNRTILAKLDLISTQANDFADSSTILVGSINQLIVDADKAAYDAEADVATLTAGELSRREESIADIETRYGNLIRSISLAFEVQSGLGDMLVTGNRFKPEKGSILNIFT